MSRREGREFEKFKWEKVERGLGGKQEAGLEREREREREKESQSEGESEN